jgi:lipopolysaccharide export system protein LptA
MTRGRDYVMSAALLVALVWPSGVRAQVAEALVPDGGQAALSERESGLLSALSLTSQHGPVTISAKQLEFDYRTRKLVYRGEVMVTQADLTLRSQRLPIVLDEKAPEHVREVVAEGDVHITQGERVATGGRATFDQERQTVVLSDGAVLRDGPNEVAGERVVVYLDEERSVVQGGTGRVRAVLFPDQESLGERVADAGHEAGSASE